MLTSDGIIAILYPDLPDMQDPKGEAATSSQAGLIQCQQDVNTGKVVDILVPSASRPGGKQNQHSSAYVLLIAYAKKETASIVNIIAYSHEQGSLPSLEKRLMDRYFQLEKNLKVLDFCTTLQDVAKTSVFRQLTSSFKNIRDLAAQAQETLPLLVERLRPAEQDRGNDRIIKNLKKIEVTHVHSMAGRIATAMSNPLLRDLNKLPNLTYKKPEEGKERKIHIKLPREQDAFAVLSEKDRKSRGETDERLNAVTGLLDLRSVPDNKIIPVIARHLILVRLVFWNKLRDLKDEDIIKSIVDVYKLKDITAERIQSLVSDIYTRLRMVGSSVAQTAETELKSEKADRRMAMARAEAVALSGKEKVPGFERAVAFVGVGGSVATAVPSLEALAAALPDTEHAEQEVASAGSKTKERSGKTQPIMKGRGKGK